MTQRSDEELLADHLAGRDGAFDNLAQRYAHELFGFLSRFVGNAAAAEDLVQEAFLQVHLAAASFDPARTFRPWLYTIAANKARDFLRSRGRRHELSLDAPLGDEDGPSPAAGLEGANESLAERSDADERAQEVRTQIERMPVHLREILVLGYYQQLPYAQIAEILDIPVGTVKSRLHAAVAHFAKLWQRRAKTDPSERRQTRKG